MAASTPDRPKGASASNKALDTATVAALSSLLLMSTRLHPDDIARAVAEEGARMGLLDLTIHLVDLEQRELVGLRSPGMPDVEALTIDATVAGRAYRTERSVVGEMDDHGISTLFLPLLDSAERYGVVTARIDGRVSPTLVRSAEALVNLVGELVANKSCYGDTIARARRTRPLSLAAELRWSMLPPMTFTGRNLTITGLVEPAYEIAGDTFDYAVDGDHAKLAIVDAVGHGLEAARIANLVVGAYRHCRRRDLDLVRTYHEVDAVLAQEFGAEKFATAQLASLSLSSGRLSWVNAGHPMPMLMRAGHRLDLTSEVFLPLGLGEQDDPVVTETALEPGDLVLFFTDGVVEARREDGMQFGRERLADLVERAAGAQQTPAETLRLLGRALMDHQDDHLQDDATLLLLAWDGPPG